MTLSQTLESLALPSLLRLADKVMTEGMQVWDFYCGGHNPQYYDSIVGMHHVIDKEILKRAADRFKSVFIDGHPVSTPLRNLVKNNNEIVYDNFLEPITALQDTDWELPELVETFFYSVYNIHSYIEKRGKDESALKELRIGVQQGIEVLLKGGIYSHKELVEMLESHKM